MRSAYLLPRGLVVSKFPEKGASRGGRLHRVARAPAREKDVSVVEPYKAVSLRPSRRELEAGKEEALLEELGAVGHFIPFISASGHEKNVLPEMASGCDSVGPCMSEMRLNLG